MFIISFRMMALADASAVSSYTAIIFRVVGILRLGSTPSTQAVGLGLEVWGLAVSLARLESSSNKGVSENRGP